MDETMPWEEVVFVGTVLTLMTAIALLVLWQGFRIVQLWLGSRLERQVADYATLKQEVAELRARLSDEPSPER